MKLDKFSQPIFNSTDLFDILYIQGIENLENAIVDKDQDLQLFLDNHNLQIQTSDQIDYNISVDSFDSFLQKNWFMPDNYKQLDIENFVVSICPTENYQRLIEELQAFRERDLLDLLRWLKYFVDTCRNHDIVWGVGRGSSVSSYVLYLIGVHKIDSHKYNLDWRDFLR